MSTDFRRCRYVRAPTSALRARPPSAALTLLALHYFQALTGGRAASPRLTQLGDATGLSRRATSAALAALATVNGTERVGAPGTPRGGTSRVHRRVPPLGRREPFVRVPLPLLATPRLTPGAKLVALATLWLQSVRGGRPVHPTNRGLRELTGLSRSQVHRGLGALQDLGLLLGGTLVAPTWLLLEGRRFLLEGSLGADLTQGGVSNLPRVGEVGCVKSTTSDLVEKPLPRELQGRSSRKSERPSNYPQEKELKMKEETAGAQHPLCGVDPELELNPEGGSQTYERLAATFPRPRGATGRVGAGGPRVLRDSGPQFHRTPSKRPEWNRWRGKPAEHWGPMDLVGYWVCRYVECRGLEDERFFVTSVRAAARDARNGRLFTEAWLGGSWEAARDLVDFVLGEAEARGMLCQFNVYFTPGREANVRTLRAGGFKSGVKTRAEQLREENDRDGEMSHEEWLKLIPEDYVERNMRIIRGKQGK